MYKCDECGKTFEVPTTYREDMSGGGHYETFFVSPCCRDTYSEAELCEVCEENYVGSNGEHEICDECYEVISNKLFVLEKEFNLQRYSFVTVLEDWIERNW